jgi:FtsX-like permease family
MVSYSVAQRTREIGIRMAQVLRMVMVEGFRPIFVGLVVGVVASAGVSRLFAATLFGPNPNWTPSRSLVCLACWVSSRFSPRIFLPAGDAHRADGRFASCVLGAIPRPPRGQ